jgi:small subunit ribosomal protein S21
MATAYPRPPVVSRLQIEARRSGQGQDEGVSARLHPRTPVWRREILFVCPSPFRGARRAAKGEFNLVQIFVRDNNVDQALKALKKKMQREGSFREMKRHVHYEKPSEKRARQKAEAVRRARKLARKRMQREGLLPPPKPRVPGVGGPRS